VVLHDDSSWRDRNANRLDRQVLGYVKVVCEALTKQGNSIYIWGQMVCHRGYVRVMT
jgi:uncharacterized protein involved in tolerance to divalent cations